MIATSQSLASWRDSRPRRMAATRLGTPKASDAGRATSVGESPEVVHEGRASFRHAYMMRSRGAARRIHGSYRRQRLGIKGGAQ